MNDDQLNYLAALERERAFWMRKYFDLLEHTKRLFFGFAIAMLIAIFGILNLYWYFNG